MPEADRQVDRVLHSRHSNVQKKTDAQWVPRVSFKNERDERFWNIGAFNLLVEIPSTLA